MGEDSPATTTQTQSATSEPWKNAQPLLDSLLKSYGGMSTAQTPEQIAATKALTAGTSAIPNFGADASGALDKAFNFSTDPQVGMLSDSFKSLQTNLGDTAAGKHLNPWETPGFADAMSTLNSDITKQVGNTYAAAGRSPSGAGSMPQTLARGLSQGEGGLLSSQFNSNVANMNNANSMLTNAAGSTAQGQANLGLLPITTGLSGVTAAPSVANAYAAPGATALTAANAAYSNPWTNLAQLLQPATQIGALGGQTSGTGTSVSTPANSMMSNIMGGASTGIGLLSLLSDERAKTDIEPVGELDDGQTIHRYRYKGRPEFHIGLLAQDVLEDVPEAVDKYSNGLLGVDYFKATDRSAAMRKAA